MNRARLRFSVTLALIGLCGVLLSTHVDVASDTLPKQLSDRAFWEMVEEFSEPGGFFRSDNLISNETSYQRVIPAVRKQVTAGAYIGVGPDQNFTYIAAFTPRISFIIDIRRQNMLLHLMYKALIEMAADRSEFLSLLFSRPRPTHLSRDAAPEVLLHAFAMAAPDEGQYQKTQRAIMERLTKRHGFALTSEDGLSIEFVLRSFFLSGPELRYTFPQQMSGAWFPTYSELLTETDGAGHNFGYVASEESFRALKSAERNNLVVPLVADFGGGKTLRRVGAYLRQHGVNVHVFYASNVEQYLFQTDAYTRFYDNVATLPITDASVFIRSFFSVRSGATRNATILRSETVHDAIGGLLTAYRNGGLRTYNELLERTK